MKTIAALVLCAFALVLASCGGGGGGDNVAVATPASIPASRQLPIVPIAQQTPVWCWAASSEMVFRYYQMASINASSYQCGIIATVFGGACAFNCSLCTTALGPISNLQTVVNGYGLALRSLGVNSRVLSSQLVFSALPFSGVQAEIAGGRPLLIGFAPSGGVALPNISQHFGAIVGYDATAGRTDVTVNDPFPYALAGLPDPYLAVGAVMVQPGQYRVTYATLVQRLAWVNTLYAIQ